MQTTLDQLNQRLDTLHHALEPWQDHLPEADDLIQLREELATRAARFASEAQTLSIGIMGQIKAGKSSFLNALLFDGKPVLPVAATPKTANLTHIRYGEKPVLHVEYYSTDDWHAMQDLANSGASQQDARVARELIAMARQNGIDIEAQLAVRKHTQEADDMDGLLGLLNDYTGENGRFTPLVKVTHLEMPIEALKGLEVVDTPGMNDPVQSRTQKTREYMTRCDVVFFLSRAGQFLDQSDMDLLARQLPGKGVKRLVLVAGQFDSALLDDGYDQDSLASTEQNVRNRLTRVATESFNKLAEMRENMGAPEVASMLRRIATPVFASTFAHGYAHWPTQDWGDSMQHIHDELQHMARENWGGYTFTQEDWQRLANFPELTRHYEQARAEADALLQQQRDGLIPEITAQLRERAQHLIDAVQLRMNTLRTGDLSQVEHAQRACESRIQNINDKLCHLIRSTRQAAQKNAQEALKALDEDRDRYANLRTRTGTREETRSEEVSTSVLYKPWTWFSSRTVYYTVSVSYEYLFATDAIESIQAYAHSSEREIESQFNRLVSANELRHKILKTLLGEMETGSSDFDPRQFRETLERSVRMLRIPELELDIGDVTEIISSHFQGEIQSRSQMEELRTVLNQVLAYVFERLRDALNRAMEDLLQQLDTLEKTLIANLTQDLRDELDKLRQDFADKDGQLKKYQNLLEQLDAAMT